MASECHLKELYNFQLKLYNLLMATDRLNDVQSFSRKFILLSKKIALNFGGKRRKLNFIHERGSQL
jgi:hypothetical protein